MSLASAFGYLNPVWVIALAVLVVALMTLSVWLSGGFRGEE